MIEKKCPTCGKELVPVKGARRNMLKCEEHGLFRLVIKRGPRRPDMSDPNNWHAKCGECGGQMDYYNFRYGCRKCGHVMEV